MVNGALFALLKCSGSTCLFFCFCQVELRELIEYFIFVGCNRNNYLSGEMGVSRGEKEKN